MASSVGLILLLCVATSMAAYIRMPVTLEGTTETKDMMAQATCTGLASDGGWVYAVRRTCGAGAKLCRDICTDPNLKAQDSQVASKTATCVNSLHIYDGFDLDPDYSKDQERLGLKIYRYNTCTSPSCGPNYCCCRMM